MIILDTQPVSQLQRTGHRTLLESNNGSTPIPPRTSGSRSSRLSSSSKGVLRRSARQRSREAVVAICVSAETHRALQSPMERANPIFRRRRGDGVSEVFAAIGTKDRRPDARIAAIAFVHNATVLTANTRDFRLVPGLKVEDFTRT